MAKSDLCDAETAQRLIHQLSLDPGAQYLIFHKIEWEDYGQSGIGDVNGQPLREGEYLALDADGKRPLKQAMLELIKPVLPEAEAKQVAKRIADWLDTQSVSLEDLLGL